MPDDDPQAAFGRHDDAAILACHPAASLASRLNVVERCTVFLHRETIDVAREPLAVLVEQAIGPAVRNVAPAQCADRCDGFVAAERLKLRDLSVQAFVDLVKQVTAGEPVKQCEQHYRRTDEYQHQPAHASRMQARATLTPT